MLMVKTPPASAGDIRDSGLIPGLGRNPGRGHGNALGAMHSILPLETPWKEEASGPQSMGSDRTEESATAEATEQACRALKLTSDKQSKRAASQNVQTPGTPTPGQQGRSGVASASLLAMVLLVLSAFQALSALGSGPSSSRS